MIAVEKKTIGSISYYLFFIIHVLFFIYGMILTFVELIVLIISPYEKDLFWDSISYFVLIMMLVSLVYSIILSIKKLIIDQKDDLTSIHTIYPTKKSFVLLICFILFVIAAVGAIMLVSIHIREMNVRAYINPLIGLVSLGWSAMSVLKPWQLSRNNDNRFLSI